METLENKNELELENKELLKKYIVIRKTGEDYSRLLTLRENFTEQKEHDLYNEYGIQGDCWCDDSEGTECCEYPAWTWCDGANFRSIILDDNAGFEECDDDESLEFILAYKKAEFNEFSSGICRVEINGIELIQSQFATDPWICCEVI